MLEDARGLEATRLIQGMLCTASAIFVALDLCFVAMEQAFRQMMVGESGHDLWHDLGLLQPPLCLVLISELAVQTVAFFVCESSHHDGIDKSSLAIEVAGREEEQLHI